MILAHMTAVDTPFTVAMLVVGLVAGVLLSQLAAKSVRR